MVLLTLLKCFNLILKLYDHYLLLKIIFWNFNKVLIILNKNMKIGYDVSINYVIISIV